MSLEKIEVKIKKKKDKHEGWVGEKRSSTTIWHARPLPRHWTVTADPSGL